MCIIPSDSGLAGADTTSQTGYTLSCSTMPNFLQRGPCPNLHGLFHCLLYPQEADGPGQNPGTCVMRRLPQFWWKWLCWGLRVEEHEKFAGQSPPQVKASDPLGTAALRKLRSSQPMISHWPPKTLWYCDRFWFKHHEEFAWYYPPLLPTL